MFMESILEAKKQFEERIARVETEYDEFEKYAFLMYAREYIVSLDRSSQVIFYHTMKNIDIKVTSIITSLSEEKICQVLRFMKRSAFARLESFNYEGSVRDYWEIKSFVDDLIYSYDRSDAEIVKIYDEEVSVVKILRHLSRRLFNK